MNFSYLILLSAILSTIGTYVDKKIIDSGISRKNYFYYMCLTMIPFALVSLFLEIKTNNYKFCFNYIVIILLLMAAFLRYIKQKSFVGCYRKLEPYEFKTYMSVTLIICFFIDIVLGIQTFTILKLLSIILIIVGVILTYNIKVNIKKFQKDLVIRIISDVIMGYVVYNILKYWSNGFFILLLNLLLTLLFTPIYKPYKKENNISLGMFGLILLQQTFGFTYTYINNYLSSNSVTLSTFVSPISLIFITITAFLLRKKKKPSIKNIIGIVLAGIGICLIKLF